MFQALDIYYDQKNQNHYPPGIYTLVRERQTIKKISKIYSISESNKCYPKRAKRAGNVEERKKLPLLNRMIREVTLRRQHLSKCLK